MIVRLPSDITRALRRTIPYLHPEKLRREAVTRPRTAADRRSQDYGWIGRYWRVAASTMDGIKQMACDQVAAFD